MRQNIADYYALTFLIRSKGLADEDLWVHLRDNPTYTYPAISAGLPIVAGGYLAGGGIVTQAYRRVTIPIADLLRDSEGFIPELWGWVVFSGDSATQRTYLIDDLRVVATRQELEKLAGGAL